MLIDRDGLILATHSERAWTGVGIEGNLWQLIHAVLYSLGLRPAPWSAQR